MSAANSGGTAFEALPAAQAVGTGSNRAFGWVMATAAALVGAYASWFGLGWQIWPWGLAGLLALMALLLPRALAPFNRAWMRFGALLGRIVSPLVMGLIYFLLVTPIAWLARSFGADPMRRRFDPGVTSYWIEREPPGPDPGTMERQH